MCIRDRYSPWKSLAVLKNRSKGRRLRSHVVVECAAAAAAAGVGRHVAMTARVSSRVGCVCVCRSRVRR